MNPTTHLEALDGGRARQLFDLLRQASHDEDSALALDDQGRVTGLVPADDPRPQHLLGDLDVHA